MKCLLLCAALVSSVPLTARAAVVEKIAAVVNGEIILQSELEDRIRPMLAEVRKESDPALRQRRETSVRREVLDRLVDEELLQQQARELKVAVTPQDVDKAVDEVKKRNNISDTQLNEALLQQGLDIATYRQEVKRQITRIKVIEIAVRAKVAVSDDDIKRYYDQNLRQLGADRKVRASHIFLAIPEGATNAEAEQVRKSAADLVRQARNGADFAKLAKEHSQDSATRQEGGDLGYFGRGMLPPAVEEIVFAMDPGEVRGPVRAERGFHIIKLVDRQDEKARTYEEVKDQLREQLYQQELDKHTRSWLGELKKRAHVQIRL
jgi:parvulin-like peptidyl-prolyl isomerase